MMRPILTTTAAVLAITTVVVAPASAITTRHAKKQPPGRNVHSLLGSPQLWATIDVCNPSDQPYTIGIRGSMPGDGHAHEQMYMRFIIQYRDARGGSWKNVGASADTGFVAVGSANAAARESGRSFVFRTTQRGAAYRLRGLVMFQWRRGIHVIHDTVRYTQAGHNSGASADPRGYSASTCVMT